MFKGLTYSFTILFILLLVNLSLNARFAADDYYFLYLNMNYGPVDGTIFQYMDFSGRWLCHFISLLALNLSGFRFFLPAYFVFTFAMLYLILSSLFYKIYTYYDIDENDFNSDLPPLLLLASFILCSFSVGENWFWFISVSTYIWSISFSLLLVNLYINNKKRFYKPALIIFASLYIGSASESYALLMIIFSILYIIFKIRTEGIETFKSDPKQKTLITSLILIFISFLISTLSPGTFHRNDLLPSLSLLQKSEVLIKSFAKIFIQYLPSKLFLFILFGVPWIRFGFYIQEITSMTTKNVLKNIGLTMLFTILAILISLLPTVFILGEMGPARALSMITLIMTAATAITFTLFGMMIRTESEIIKITSVSFFLLITYLFFVNIKEYSVTSLYAKLYDERTARINELKNANFTGIAELPPLPPSGMLYNAELSIDTSYFVNQHWKKGLDLNYNVVLAE